LLKPETEFGRLISYKMTLLPATGSQNETNVSDTVKKSYSIMIWQEVIRI